MITNVNSFRAIDDTIPTNTVKGFEIDTSNKLDCKLENKKFYVKKVLWKESAENGKEYRFYGSLNEEFIEIDKGQYEEQIGFGWCGMGFIFETFVEGSTEEKKEEVVPTEEVPIEEVPIDARNCGIAVIFSVLCMSDTDVNPGNEINLDLNWRFEIYPPAIEMIKNRCEKVIGLDMGANPPKGANAYFSAAIRTGHKIMIVQKIEEDEFAFIPVDLAQQSFNENGYTLPKYYNNWFFCKEK